MRMWPSGARGTLVASGRRRGDRSCQHSALSKQPEEERAVGRWRRPGASAGIEVAREQGIEELKEHRDAWERGNGRIGATQ